MQLESQRREYEDLRRKIDQGRRYRHDMRHHLRVLEGLFDEARSEEGLQYLSTLNGQLTELEQEACCENATVNAVLRSYIGRAKEENCQVTVKAEVPQTCPVDEIDLCVILANGMENAINACRGNARDTDKWIKVSVLTHENGNMPIKIENLCDRTVVFGKDGLPKGQSEEHHGIGLKSVKAVVKKYDGILRCEESDGVFSLRAVLFKPTDPRRGKKRVSGKTAVHTLLTVLLCLLLINCMPDIAKALESVPLLGSVVHLVDLRNYQLEWGDTSFEADLPAVESEPAEPSSQDDADLSDGAEDMNQQMEEYIAQVRETFQWYVTRKYQGYVTSDTGYYVLRDDQEMLSVCFYTTINAGGSGEYSRCFTLDKSTGHVLNLSDLFAEGSDYMGIISADILRQMTEQVEAGEGDYFIPGGIWSDEECFQAIDADQNFYLDEDNQLVIIFDEYEVAPGSMGMPHFVVDDQAIAGILAPWLENVKAK